MVEIKFPDIEIPAFKISKGQLLNVNLLGVGLVIPPGDITFWPETRILRGFTLFDTSDIVKGVGDLLGAVPEAVWNLARAKLDELAADYYERHSEET